MKQLIQKLGMLAAMLLAFIRAAAYDFVVNGISYEILSPIDNTVAVISSTAPYAGAIYIPSEVDAPYFDPMYKVTYKVTQIGNNAFKDCTDLRFVSIPNTVKSIGDNAFENSGILDLVIPGSVISVGNDVFKDCKSLVKVAYPWELSCDFDSYNTKLYYGDADAYDYDDVYLPIRTRYHCNDYSIDNNGILFDSYNVIFAPLNIAGDIALPDGCTIGDDAFWGCSELTGISSHSISLIGNNAFYACTNLRSITSDECSSSIGSYAFYRCNNLTDVHFGKRGANSIGMYAFCFCGIESLIISEGATFIGEHAFSCSNLKDITIPNTVTYIGDAAFLCTELFSITIPESITEINPRVFSYCEKLKNVHLPNTITFIGESAFEECYNLQFSDDFFPKSLERIGDNAFSVRNSLHYGSQQGFISLPNSLKSIGDGGFAGNNNYYRSVKSLPEQLEYIGPGAFDHCYFQDLIIPKSVMSCDNAFGNYGWNSADQCKSAYPSHLNNPFETNNWFHPICYPDDAIIDNCGVIYDADKTTILYAPRNLNGKNAIPNTVTTIGDYAFEYTYVSEEFEIPESLAFIGKNNFCNIYSLTRLELPNIRSIGEGCFMDCSHIEQILFGKNLLKIGDNSFDSSYRPSKPSKTLNNITCDAPVPPICGNNVFSMFGKECCDLIVPEESIDAYKEADIWRDFYTESNAKDLVEDGILITVENDKIVVDGYVGTDMKIYTTDGRCLYSGTTRDIEIAVHGIYIIKIADKTVKVSI